jgi:poly-gamma-glutamate synthase PgsB/CapB
VAAPPAAFATGPWLENAVEQFYRYADYFGSSFENSIGHLLVFACLVLLIVLAKHGYSNYTFRRARQRIPICIGGWGTRGKSGTERLKAALIAAMGHGLVSKTTGCEAMFIHGEPFGDPLEIPLFRPYEKATIWEQRDLIRMAAKMEPSVFLWECMALTPSYVDVLQRQWTRDDLSTITNTYPDHEDLQGPAGHDVATTIAGFVPEKSRLITTEEQMLPYVAESCRHVDTTLRGVGWLQSGLITGDVLGRFPYQEHPDNVALVTAMADELGVEEDLALKAMGDYLVPDLGVLKTHPISTVRTRKIEFTNGMSANERFGCMGNWKRLGFDQQDPWQDPTTWVSGVVNNRADRVPRSKVFAKIMVDDISVDRFFLIGNNLSGLLGFIEEAWQEKAGSLSLCDPGHPWQAERALETLERAAHELRQPVTPQLIETKLRWMLRAIGETEHPGERFDPQQIAAQWESPEEVTRQLERSGVERRWTDVVVGNLAQWTTAYGEYRELVDAIRNATPRDAAGLNRRFVEVLESWYFRKLVVVENYDASGEEVLSRIVEETPPGFLNRILGLQNIKGTGLDFVYRFQAWDACVQACEAAESDDFNFAARGLDALLSMPAIGQLCVERVAETINKCQRSKTQRRPDLCLMLEQLAEKLHSSCEEQGNASHKPPGCQPPADPHASSSLATWNGWMLENGEAFLDASDSLRRRDRADAIYRDLAAGRIGRQRAVTELRQINQRQKGGWLRKKSEPSRRK